MTYQGYTIETVLYKGWVIEHCSLNGFMYYPSDKGRTSESCDWASCLENAKESIDERIMMSRPLYFVETQNPEGTGPALTKFEWIADAVAFAAKFNGKPLFEIQRM